MNIARLTVLMNDFDPCGLIGLGAPPDEYDCLTHQIFSFIQKNKSRNEIKELILHEIEHHFGWSGISNIEEPYKIKFLNDLENFLDKVVKEFQVG